MANLSEILVQVNAYIDLDATLPTGTELTTRVNYADRSVKEAASDAIFPELRSIYHVNPSALASVSMPAGFRELEERPAQATGGGWSFFDVIKPYERYQKESGDKYCYVLGNPAAGYTVVFNGLEANVTVSFDYQRFPSGFATLTDICELPDPLYVTSKTESYVLQSRSDDRFPIKDSEAQRRLANMTSRSGKDPAGGVNTVRKKGASAYSIGS